MLSDQAPYIEQLLRQQSYPLGCLYVMATPIGNLLDLSFRAWYLLQITEVLICEDPSHTKKLLSGLGIDFKGKMLKMKQHEENTLADRVISYLQSGLRAVYVCNAGTPTLNDPGNTLVNRLHLNNLRVIPIPGASSITAILSVSGGLSSAGYRFLGFMPKQKQQIEVFVEKLNQCGESQVFLVAPRHFLTMAKTLAILKNRRITIGRELTKQFEEVCSLPAGQLVAWVQDSTYREMGEFIVVVHAENTDAQKTNEHLETILSLLIPSVSIKTSVELARLLTGVGKKEIYAKALSLKSQTLV